MKGNNAKNAWVNIYKKEAGLAGQVAGGAHLAKSLKIWE
jgi:hypothetical protein